MKQDVILGVPPAFVAGGYLFGYTLPEWAAIITIIYTVLLGIKLVWSEYRAWMTRRKTR